MLLGWPAIILAIGLAAGGIVRRKPWMPLASMILLLPISLYLTGSPGFRWLGIMAPALLIVCAVAVNRRHVKIAWACLVPIVAGVAWLALAVVSQ